MRIALADIVMDEGTPDTNGFVWLCTALTGWDSAEASISEQEFTTKDGNVRARSTYKGRALVLEGICKASGDGYWTAYNYLLGLLGNLNHTVQLAVDEGPTRKYLDVARAGKVQSQIKVGHFVFNVPLMAADPIKYGENETVAIPAGATRVIRNVGNYPTSRIEATTTSTGKVRLNNSTQTAILSSGNVTVGNGTAFDMRRRTVYRAGENRYHELATTSSWWTLDPGDSTIINEGDAAISFVHRPAWV